MTFKQFRKKPVVIAARRLGARQEIRTREGTIVGEPGDWLLVGVEGEEYPCSDRIFRATYDPVDENGKVISWEGIEDE